MYAKSYSIYKPGSSIEPAQCMLYAISQAPSLIEPSYLALSLAGPSY